MRVDNLLNKQLQSEVNKSLAALNDLVHIIDVAKAAGEDTSEWEARADHLKQYLSVVRENFCKSGRCPTI